MVKACKTAAVKVDPKGIERAGRVHMLAATSHAACLNQAASQDPSKAVIGALSCNITNPWIISASAAPSRPVTAGSGCEMNVIHRSSKWLHKILGLALILFLIWMSLSGVLLNHPDLIAGVSVPRWLVPSQYHPQNWNRSGIVSAVFPESEPGAAYLAGKLGIYKRVDGRVSPQSVHAGLPDSDFYRKTQQLFLLQRPEGEWLLAATEGGLYARQLPDGIWLEQPLGEHREPVRKILQTNDELLVFTESAAYAASIAAPVKYAESATLGTPAATLALEFSRRQLERPPSEPRVSLIKLFFDLHDGKVWGLPGRLLFDAAGLLLCYLSVSAFYAWYYPRLLQARRRRGGAKPGRWMGRLFRFIHKYHLKLGIWSAGFLLLFGLTGFFMRPPMLMLLAGDVPAAWYPGPLPANPWQQKIKNALYDPAAERVLIQADDGVWRGRADLSGPFTRINLPAPIFVMGATVFDTQPNGSYLVGSFSGLYRVDPSAERAVNLLVDEAPDVERSMRPAATMVTGWLTSPEGDAYIATHYQGLVANSGEAADAFQMPPEVREQYRMPLWNYLFEVHNGRFFQEWLGGGYILIVPLGALLLVLITLTGVYDWLRNQLAHRRRQRQRLA